MLIQTITQIKIAPGAYLALNFRFLEIKDKIGAAKVIRVKINEAINKIFCFLICFNY